MKEQGAVVVVRGGGRVKGQGTFYHIYNTLRTCQICICEIK